MQSSDQEHDPIHLKVVGWYCVASGAISVVICLGVAAFLTFFGVASVELIRQNEMPAWMGALMGGGALLVLGYMTVMSIVEVLAGIGVLKRRSWGRLLAALTSLMRLPIAPIGTAIGLYSLWALFQPGSQTYFASDDIRTT